MELEKIIAVDTMQTYIAIHLHEPITLHALAKCCGYSPWYAAKIFKEVTNDPPFAYIRKLRLSQAALALWDENQRVIDIALDFVFDSHDGFTRAFSKQFGITPKAYREDTIPVTLFKPDSMRDHYRYLQGNDPIQAQEPISDTCFVQVMKFPKRKLIYMPCEVEADEYFAYVSEVGCDVWGLLCSIREALYEPMGIWFPASLQPDGCSQYVQGVEVPWDYDKPLVKGLQMMDLEACEMMVFQGASYEDERYEEAITKIAEEIRHFRPELYGYQWDDDAAYCFQLEPQGYRGYIEARPIKALSATAYIAKK